MSEEGTPEKPKKKRGRPKGAKNKAKSGPKGAPKEAPKPETPKEAPKPETPKEAPKPETPKAEAAKTESKEETTIALEKKGESEKPKPKEYSPEEIAEIAKKVETPKDNTPPYKPKYILSPEFKGNSNYEIGIISQKEELEAKLSRLRRDPDTNPQEIQKAEEDLKTLDYLFENYHMGMNVFRTAKGGREKLRV